VILGVILLWRAIAPFGGLAAERLHAAPYPREGL
jgi:hypothetical protein